jgi:hypothetical protein
VIKIPIIDQDRAIGFVIIKLSRYTIPTVVMGRLTSFFDVQAIVNRFQAFNLGAASLLLLSDQPSTIEARPFQRTTYHRVNMLFFFLIEISAGTQMSSISDNQVQIDQSHH